MRILLQFPQYHRLWMTIVTTVFLCVYSIAQNVTFEPVYYNITTEHGLPSMETYSVKQDSKGFIWICTDAGVCRYDGYEFRTFTTKDGLTDNVVFDTYEDHKGRIWFLTYNSMLCYWDGKKIREYAYNDRIFAHLNGRKSIIKSLLIDKNNTFYYNLNRIGLIEITDKGDLQEIPGLSGSVVIHSVQNQPILSCNAETNTHETIKLVDKRVKSKVVLFDITAQNNPYYGIASNGYEQNKNYFFAYNSVYSFKDTRKVITGKSMISLTIKDSLFWVGQIGGGAVHGVIRNGQFSVTSTLLPDYSVTGILVDKHRGVWFSTIEGGVFYIRNPDAQRANFQKKLKNEDIVNVLDWRKQMFITTQECLVNLSSGKSYETFDAANLIDEIPYFRVLDHYYNRFNTSHDPFLIRNVNVAYKRFYKSEKGEVFFAMDHFLYAYQDEYCSEFYRFEPWIENKPIQIMRLCIQNGKVVGVHGTNLVEFEDGSMRILDLNHVQRNATILNAIYPLLDRAVLVATSNRGLLIRYNDGSIQTIDESNGLVSDKATAVGTLRDGTILVGSSNGLTVLSSDGKVLKSITSNSVFGEISINAICVYDGWVYLGTKTGLLRIKESYLLTQHKPYSYDVLLKGVLFDGAHQKKTDALTFPSDANLLQIDFSVLQFDNWFSKKYQYRIGKQGQWVDLESPTISLYRPAGEFDVEIRYMDANFRWSDPARLCSVEVLVPFWMRWYFWTVIGIVLMLLSFFMYERRRNQINQRLMRENQILQLEQQMLMQQQQMEHARMNPHFVFNVLNSIHSYILHEETDQAEKYLMMFSRLMREILVKAKEGTITVSDERSVLEKYLELEQLRFKGKFRFELSVKPTDRHKIIPSMFVQPFVENAVLHGIAKASLHDAEIRVHFETESNQCMRVTISNSGVISEEDRVRLEQSGDKNAFGITKKRLANYNTLLKSELFGIALTVVNDQKPATLIILRIPIL